MIYKYVLLLVVIIGGAIDPSNAQIINTNNRVSKDFHDWALTPPMGWNSWDCYGPNVTEAEVKANADFMSDKLKEHGWEFIVIDIRWYVANDHSHGYNEIDPQYNIDSFGRFQPAVNRFPSAVGGKGFKPIADYLHGKGLKFGIHIMRGIPVVAVDNEMPIKGTGKTAADIYSNTLQCKWLHDMYTVDASKEGAQDYYNSLMELYASWGVDFIKCDDLSRPYHTREIEMIRKAIDGCGRPILLSMSPGETPILEGSHAQSHSNMWRTIDDFWDNWDELKMHFEIFRRWNKYRVLGAYPDGDMLPMGHIGIRAERGDDRQSLLTRNEQYTLISLFSIFKSPLMFGGDLPTSNPFAISLLTNEEVIYLLNNSRNNREFYHDNDKVIWTALDSKSDATYFALFNLTDHEQRITASIKDLTHIEGRYKAVNIWTKEEKISSEEEISSTIGPHGVSLFKVLPE